MDTDTPITMMWVGVTIPMDIPGHLVIHITEMLASVVTTVIHLVQECSVTVLQENLVMTCMVLCIPRGEEAISQPQNVEMSFIIMGLEQIIPMDTGQ